jgi:hypothetical protein
MITINLLECVQRELKNNNRSYPDVTEVFIKGKYRIDTYNFYKCAANINYDPTRELIDPGLIIKGNDFIIDVRLARGYATVLNFIDLKAPEKTVQMPCLISHRDGMYVGD